ncbi:MAG: RNA polymerase sigma factor [Solirubrobacteraceae bacterium]
MASDGQGTRMDPAREQALVARARADSAAFGELYDFYLPRIYGYVARRVGERAMAEDLTAATFERALGAVRGDDFRNASFGGFLYRVAANAVVDHVRRERHTVPLRVRASDHDDQRDPGGAESISDESALRAFATAVDRDTLRRALVHLPEAHRRVILLKYFDGLELDELCAALGCSRPTFAVKLHRALRALRAVITQEATDAA